VMAAIKDARVLVVKNKTDLPSPIEKEILEKFLEGKPVANVSVVQKKGLDILEGKIIALALPSHSSDVHAVVVSNVRHAEALKRCHQALSQAQTDIRQNISLEFISEHLKLAIHDLDNITGRDIDADLIDQIFSQFCIGK
ncbi:MAG: hypothetical protein COW13_03475, partial [Candidatus Omnitrophica bacterium CG12_big_fil_rev_8_21_14_0_65_50_5]